MRLHGEFHVFFQFLGVRVRVNVRVRRVVHALSVRVQVRAVSSHTQQTLDVSLLTHGFGDVGDLRVGDAQAFVVRGFGYVVEFRFGFTPEEALGFRIRFDLCELDILHHLVLVCLRVHGVHALSRRREIFLQVRLVPSRGEQIRLLVGDDLQFRESGDLLIFLFLLLFRGSSLRIVLRFTNLPVRLFTFHRDSFALFIRFSRFLFDACDFPLLLLYARQLLLPFELSTSIHDVFVVGNVHGLGCVVHGLGCVVHGLGCVVHGLGCVVHRWRFHARDAVLLSDLFLKRHHLRLKLGDTRRVRDSGGLCLHLREQLFRVS